MTRVGARGELSPIHLELEEQHTFSNDDSVGSDPESKPSKEQGQVNSKQKFAPNVLDQSYKVRNHDYKLFFRPGRVFMTLWTEQLGSSKNMPDKNVSDIIFSEKVLSRIRRFVVVRQQDQFCTCLPIMTYDSKNKKGTNLKDHGIIHTQNSSPSITGLSKAPVRVHVTKDATFRGAFRDVSLINYAKIYSIEMNLKVSDVGELDSASRRALRRNFNDAFVSQDESLRTMLPPPKLPLHLEGAVHQKIYEQGADRRPPAKQGNIDLPLDIYSSSEVPQPPSTFPSAASQYVPSGIEDSGPSTARLEGTGQLDSSFGVIGKPPRFFRLGRVFKVLWTEPAGTTAKDSDPTYYHKVSYNERVYTKIRRFVVIRERTHSCLCLPLYTYGGQGTTKSDVRSQDHALVYSAEQQTPPAPTAEEVLEKEPFSIVVEDSNEQIDTMTRMNFSQVYTIQHNVKVAKVGRIAKDQLDRLNSYFVESITAT